MKSSVAAAFYLALMAVIIVAVDVLFFKDRFWARLLANLVIALIFATFYFRFLRRA